MARGSGEVGAGDFHRSVDASSGFAVDVGDRVSEPELAQQARDTYAEHGASMENELAEVEQSLKEHPLAVDVE